MDVAAFAGRRLYSWGCDCSGSDPLDPIIQFNMVGISTHLEFGILGMVILFGVIGDEVLKKMAKKQLSAR